MGSMVDTIGNKVYCSPRKIVNDLSEEERKAIAEGGVVPQEILKNLEALGLVFVSPRFWWVTQLGEYIKEMIVDKREMTTGEAEAYLAGLRHAKVQALRAIDDEPELPGEPNTKTIRAIQENPAIALRGSVIATKRHIRERVEKIPEVLET